MLKSLHFLLVVLFVFAGYSQNISEVVLKADGPGDTYELINSVLAPGYNAVEVPDCAHPEFGRHIDEVYDEDLGAHAFRFISHVTPDNDRCKKFDRQRVEIKSFKSSPDNLKAIEGEKVVYTWKFKLPKDFQSSKSFTHIHQIKAVGGEEASMPLITLTTRKAASDQLQLRYASQTSQRTLEEVALKPFLGTWVEVTETILYGEKGNADYSIEITKVGSKKKLLKYSNKKLRMWKTGAEFLRPKWGVYRSIKQAQDLKDEAVLFADFSIKEIEK